MKTFLVLLLCGSLFAGDPALNFTNNNSDRVNIASSTSIEDLTTFTILVWAYPTANSAAFRKFWQKATVAGGGGYRLAQVGSTSGALDGEINRTSDAICTTNSGVLTTNSWQFFAFVMTTSGASTDLHIYRGTQTTAISEASYAGRTLGSGGVTDDGTQGLVLGNNNGNASAFQGYIAYIVCYNGALTSDQIEGQRHFPHRFQSDDVRQMTWLGLVGTGNQLDLSGNNNNGTVTGATQTDGPPQVLLPWVPARKCGG